MELLSEHEGLVSEWHLRNELSPEDVMDRSDRMAWWICGEGHEWKATVRKRVGGDGCPVCGKGRFVSR